MCACLTAPKPSTCSRRSSRRSASRWRRRAEPKEERVPGKSVIRTESAPAPFQGAPYNQAIAAGGLVFVAGQLGLRPGESEMVGDSIEEQTEQAMRNLGAILEEAASGLDRLVKTTVYLTDLSDFAGMND